MRKQLREEVYEAMAEGQREEEFSKIITEKAIKSCADMVEKDGESKMEATEGVVEGTEANTNGDKHAEDAKDNGTIEEAKNGDSSVDPPSEKVEVPATKESEEKAVDSEKNETEVEAESTEKTEAAIVQAENGTKESGDKPQESNGDSETLGPHDKVASGDSKAEESKEESNPMETEVSNGTKAGEDNVEIDKTNSVETKDQAEADKDKAEAKDYIDADKSIVETKEKVDADTNIDTKDKAEADKTTGETKDKVEADKDNGVEPNDKKPVDAATEEAKGTAEDTEVKNGGSKEADEDVEMAEASDGESFFIYNYILLTNIN